MALPFEFEALVGHLYVVNGRAISTPPPGALVEVAPKKAARGRELDTFFALTLPMGETIAPHVFYENMSALAAERYFNSGGSVTAGLKAVFSHINENLYQHNNDSRRSGQRRYEASLICAVLRGADLYLARVGSAVAALRLDGVTQPFPTTFEDDDGLFGAPLGVKVDPEEKVQHFQVKTGARLVLSDPALADFSFDQIDLALGLADIGATLANLKDLCSGKRTLNIGLAAIEFVPPDAPVALPVRDVESTTEITAPTPEPAPVETETADTESADDANKKNNALTPRRSNARTEAVNRTIGGVALGGARGLEVVSKTFDVVVPKPAEGKRGWLATSAATGVAILIPVIVVVLVVMFWVSGTGESEFDRCYTQANETAELARGIASSDVQGTIEGWSAVIAKSQECMQLRPNEPDMMALALEGRNVTDILLSIDRRDAILIDTFPNATLSRVLLQGQDLYVLDNGNDQVYRVSLAPDGLSISRRQEAIPAMRRNASVAQFTIGDVVDIAWAENGNGLSQSNAITMLDANGTLIDCSPRFLQDCSSQRLPATETWNSAAKMVFWGGGLYVLDAAANQIWRYRSTGQAFSNTPTEYFTGTGRPDIRLAVDFDIDNDGIIYVLMSDGRLMRFESGNNIDFAFTFREGQAMDQAAAMFLSTNPIAQTLFFVDSADRTIFETTFSGTFMRSYRANDENMFAGLADVAVDVNRGIVYAVSGNGLYAFRRN